jgi:hypothetical protein
VKVLAYICAASVVSFVTTGITVITRGNAQEQRPSPKRSWAPPRATPTDGELARLRADVIEKMKQSRAQSEKLLALHTQEQAQLTNEYQERRSLHAQGLISRREVIEVELALTRVTTRVEEVRRWILEDDIAITEATSRDHLLRLPALAPGGYSEDAILIRFNGSVSWSLTDAPKIDKFFTQRFGRALPISAFGQTSVHDRMKFDHRDAMDVPLHPDSSEGRSLIGFLRQAGIPFIAFRNAIPGSATGAHIHIGKPSIRNAPH